MYLDPAFVQTNSFKTMVVDLNCRSVAMVTQQYRLMIAMQEARCNGRAGLRDSPTEALYATQNHLLASTLSLRFFRVARPTKRPLIDRKIKGLCHPTTVVYPYWVRRVIPGEFPSGPNFSQSQRVLWAPHSGYHGGILFVGDYPEDPG